jgi:hypothetical protein
MARKLDWEKAQRQTKVAHGVPYAGNEIGPDEAAHDVEWLEAREVAKAEAAQALKRAKRSSKSHKERLARWKASGAKISN